jgi:hypothetical protein
MDRHRWVCGCPGDGDLVGSRCLPRRHVAVSAVDSIGACRSPTKSTNRIPGCGHPKRRRPTDNDLHSGIATTDRSGIRGGLSERIHSGNVAWSYRATYRPRAAGGDQRPVCVHAHPGRYAWGCLLGPSGECPAIGCPGMSCTAYGRHRGDAGASVRVGSLVESARAEPKHCGSSAFLLATSLPQALRHGRCLDAGCCPAGGGIRRMTVPSVICNSPDGNATSRVILRLDNGDLFHIPYLAAIAEPVPAVPGSSATP